MKKNLKKIRRKIWKNFDIIGDLFPRIEDNYVPRLNWFRFFMEIRIFKDNQSNQIFKKINNLKIFYDKKWDIINNKSVQGYIKDNNDIYDILIKNMYKTSNYFISQCATFRPIIYEKFKKIKEAAIEESFERYNNANHWKELIPEKLYESKIEIEYDVIFNACSEKILMKIIKNYGKKFQ